MRVPIKTKHYTIYVHDSGAWQVRTPENTFFEEGHAENLHAALKAGKKSCKPHAYTVIDTSETARKTA